jgi:hypothetical protein
VNHDEIPDSFETRARMMRRTVRVLTSGIALLAAAMATAVYSGHAAQVTSVWGQTVISAVVVALFVYAFVMIGKYHHLRATEADSPRLAHRRMDSKGRDWRFMILLNVVVMFFVTLGLAGWFQALRPAPQVLLLFEAFFAGFMLLLAFILSAGPGWQSTELVHDEFDSALRARMMRLGYILVLLLLGAVYAVALWQPDLTPAIVIWALYVGFAVPALYYLIGDWRASRGDEG